MAFTQIARIRTLPQVLTYLKSEDPDNSISEHYLRMLVKTKPEQIGAFKSGRRNLINLDKFLTFLNNSEKEDEIPFNDYGKIRRVCE